MATSRKYCNLEQERFTTALFDVKTGPLVCITAVEVPPVREEGKHLSPQGGVG